MQMENQVKIQHAWLGLKGGMVLELCGSGEDLTHSSKKGGMIDDVFSKFEDIQFIKDLQRSFYPDAFHCPENTLIYTMICHQLEVQNVKDNLLFWNQSSKEEK